MTANLREKINLLNSLQQQADIEAFQLQLAIRYASESSGDAQVDAQLKAHAENARAQLLAVNRRIVVNQDELQRLQAELQSTP